MHQLGGAVYVLLLLSSSAIAGPPSGYQCAPGSPNIGTGCTCPASHRTERDGEDIAICSVKPIPIIAHTPTVKIAVTSTDRFKPTPATAIELKPDVDVDSLFVVESIASPVRTEMIATLESMIPEADVDAFKQWATSNGVEVR